MKILLLNQTFYPDNLATSQQIADLAVFLKDKGHEVSVVSGQRAYEERSKKFPKRETWNGVNIFRVSSTGLGKKRFRYRILDSLTFFISLAGKLLFFPKQDLVISFTSPPLMGFWGTLFCWMKGGRSVQWLMDVNPDAAFEVGYLKRRSVLGAILNTVFEFTLTSAQNVVVLDRWMKKRMLEHGAHEEKITIVPPWSVLVGGSVVITEESQAFKKQHGLSGKFVVLYSGNHSVVHPLTTLLEAALVLREDPQIAFLFIGAGLRTQDVYHFKVRHKLANIVQLPLQPREKMGASFGAADLHAVVMGSKMSGLVHTSKIYSILASGKPFVFVGPK
ncbi:MAG: glycosyltransferase WbuB, partial [Proteobacteria bacterium]|nr:glycosyltransferase WbuB [Pseudomonadota bacterium]